MMKQSLLGSIASSGSGSPLGELKVFEEQLYVVTGTSVKDTQGVLEQMLYTITGSSIKDNLVSHEQSMYVLTLADLQMSALTGFVVMKEQTALRMSALSSFVVMKEQAALRMTALSSFVVVKQTEDAVYGIHVAAFFREV